MSSDPSRRRTLAVLAGATAAAALGSAGVCAGRIALAPASEGSEESPWVRVARLRDLSPTAPARVRVIADQRDGYVIARNEPLGLVWLLRSGDTVKAFSAVCPHLGCTIDLSGDGKQFYCPCHTSYFELDGSRSSGKPNKSLRGLDPLPARVVKNDAGDELVEVQYRRFRVGTEKAEAI